MTWMRIAAPSEFRRQTLNEEKNTDERLTEIAESTINAEESQEEEEQESKASGKRVVKK